MNRIPLADWAAQAPWSGISGKPSWAGTNGPLVDLSGVTWDGVAPGYVFWNGQRFLSTTVATSPGGGGTKIKDGDEPAIAVRRRPPANPSGEFENVWARYVFNVKLYGATGQGTDDLQAINSAIFELNAAGMGMLYFPAGRYYCSTTPDRITGFSLVKGDGIGVTTLVFNGANGLFFDPPSSDAWSGAQGFAVEQVGTALTFLSGKAAVRDVAISCTAVGLSLGRSASHLSAASVRDTHFVSAGTAAIAVLGYGSELELSDLEVLGSGEPWFRGISLEEGLAAAFHDLYISNCLEEAIFVGSTVTDSRIHDITFGSILGAKAVSDTGTSNYVNELFGVGGNTDTRFDNRKELYSIFSWGPGTVAPGYGFYDDFTVPGAALGDQCILGAPYSFYEGISSDIRVVAADSVRATLFNLGTATVDFAPANWKMRIFN
jgi:hypothetical protein